MNILEENELLVVTGGDQNTQDVAKNAQEAEAVCGNGNVKSVSATGFTCKG